MFIKEAQHLTGEGHHLVFREIVLLAKPFQNIAGTAQTSCGRSCSSTGPALELTCIAVHPYGALCKTFAINQSKSRIPAF